MSVQQGRTQVKSRGVTLLTPPLPPAAPGSFPTGHVEGLNEARLRRRAFLAIC